MMNKYGLLGIAILSTVFALPARAEVAPSVFISEINWAGSQTSTADEWIELVNVSTTPVDLSHWVLTGSATSGSAIEIAAGTVIQPQDTLLITNYALGDPKTTVTTEPELVTTAISLPNSALDILLTTPDGLVIDSYTDPGTPDFGSTAPQTSITRDLTTFSWMSSTQSLGLSDPAQLGTPGYASLAPVAAPATTEHSDETTDSATIASETPAPEALETESVTETPSLTIEPEASAVFEASPETEVITTELATSVDVVDEASGEIDLVTVPDTELDTLVEIIDAAVSATEAVDIPPAELVLDEPVTIEVEHATEDTESPDAPISQDTELEQNAADDTTQDVAPSDQESPPVDQNETAELNTEVVPEVAVEPITVTETIEAPTTEQTPLKSAEEPNATEPLTSDFPLPTSDSTTSVVQKIAPGDLLLNELVSDPVDGVEWVELFNASPSNIDLTDFTLVDAAGATTKLPSLSLLPGAFTLITNPAGKLNNSGDTTSLFDNHGTLLDTLTYGTDDVPAPEDGASLARTATGTWQIATATPATPNVFPIVTLQPETSQTDVSTENEYEPLSTHVYETLTNTTPAAVDHSGTASGTVAQVNHAQSSGTESVHRVVAIAKPVNTSAGKASTKTSTAKKMGSKSAASAKTTKQTITGTVVALPGTFGKQTMYVDGHEIYFNAANWPTLSIGDVVKITGTPSTVSGYSRIKISAASDIVILDHVDVFGTPVDGSEIVSLPHGALVSVAGRIIGRSGDKLTLTTDDGTVVTVVAHQKTGVSWAAVQSGQAIITGVVRFSEDGPRLYVRSQHDVHITPVTAEHPENLDVPKPVNTSPIVGGGLLTGSIGALGTWYIRSRKNLFPLFS